MRQDVTGFFTMLQGARARGGVGIQGLSAGWRFRTGRGVVGIQDPGAGWGGDSSPGAGWGWGFEPGRGVEIFW